MVDFIPWNETHKRRKHIRFCYKPVFVEFPATADHNMGGRRKRGSLGYHNLPFSRKEYATELFPANRINILVKDAINHFCSHKLKVFLKEHFFAF